MSGKINNIEISGSESSKSTLTPTAFEDICIELLAQIQGKISNNFMLLSKLWWFNIQCNYWVKIGCNSTGILNATEKWTMPIQNWSQALPQLSIYFEGRLDGVLEI